MRVTKIKSTKRIFEGSSSSGDATLMANAKQYHPEDDIEIVEMTDTEFSAAIKKQSEGDMSASDKKDKLIKEEEKLILKEQATQRLKDKGLLDADGELIE